MSKLRKDDPTAAELQELAKSLAAEPKPRAASQPSRGREGHAMTMQRTLKSLSDVRRGR